MRIKNGNRHVYLSNQIIDMSIWRSHNKLCNILVAKKRRVAARRSAGGIASRMGCVFVDDYRRKRV